jgi:hypothetical protein
LIGVNQIALKRRYPFRPARLLRPAGQDAAGNTVWCHDDPQLQQAYNHVLAGADVPGSFVSVDLFSPRDLLIRKVSHAALRPVSEIENRSFMHRFHALAGEKLPPDVVSFSRGDITNPEDLLRIREQHPDRKFRVVFLGTVVNQLGEDKIGPTVDTAMELLDDRYDDAVVLILDFAYPDPEDPSIVRLHPRWGQGTYSLLAIYKNDEKPRKARLLFQYLTSRPNEVVVGPDEMVLQGTAVGVREALLKRANSQRVA